MPEDDILIVARSLISAHGSGAIAVARRAAENVRQLGIASMAEWWEKVVAVLEAMPPASSITD